jgi:hypothetical protein
MRTARLLSIVATLAAYASLAMVSAPNAQASCAMPPGVEQAARAADVVFVGTVASTSNRDLWATVVVEEVWRGPDQPRTVLVKGGAGGDMMTSVDRTFEVGVRYLFFPSPNADGFSDDACSSTMPWSDELLALRPEDARQPIGAAEPDPGSDVGGLVAPIAVAIVVALALVGAGLLARGRQSA